MGKTFWKDGFQGKTKGGYYFRAFDLVKFFKRLKDSGEEGTMEWDIFKLTIKSKKTHEDKLLKL